MRRERHRVGAQGFREGVGAVEQRVLEHFAVAAEYLFRRQRGEKRRANYHCLRLAEHTYLIFQTGEVHAGLAAHGSVHGPQNGRGDVYAAYAALICGGGESSKVGHHTSANVHGKRMPRKSRARHGLPYI